MYLKKIVLGIVLVGLVIGGVLAYTIYNGIFSPNTNFSQKEAYVFIPSDADFSKVQEIIEPLLEEVQPFRILAKRKGYATNIKGGRYRIMRDMNTNAIIDALRSKNIPVTVSFNNQETLAALAGRISTQIEADSTALLTAFNDINFLKQNDFTDATKLGMYLPNSYEFFWNTSAEQFRERMLKEYRRFWNDQRKAKADALNLSPMEVTTLASIVHKESTKVDERPRVAGVYLNRLRKGMRLQADPTIIYALKLSDGDFTKVYKRVLYKDLELESPYNTYKYSGLPPGPIAMPDISAIDAVLNSEKHDYLYFVANVENFGYHMFAKSLTQHNRNKKQYIQWVNKKKIKR